MNFPYATKNLEYSKSHVCLYLLDPKKGKPIFMKFYIQLVPILDIIIVLIRTRLDSSFKCYTHISKV